MLTFSVYLMKLFRLLVPLLGLTLFARAQEGATNIHIDLLVVSVPNAKAMELLPQLRDAGQIDKACATIQTLMESQQARLVGWPMLITKSGNRAVVEMIQEVRYASEYNDTTGMAETAAANAALAAALAVPADNAAPAPGAPAAPAAPAPAPEKKPVRPPGEEPIIPSSFETRNTGTTLEIEPSSGPDGTTIDMQFSAQHIHLAGWEKITVTEPKRSITVEQPRFVTNKVTANITMANGKRLLVGSFAAPDQPDWTELFIMQATIKPAKK